MPYLSHWTITAISKPVQILSHSIILGILFLLPMRYNTVRGVMWALIWAIRSFSALDLWLVFGQFTVTCTTCTKMSSFYCGINLCVRNTFISESFRVFGVFIKVPLIISIIFGENNVLGKMWKKHIYRFRGRAEGVHGFPYICRFIFTNTE